MNTASTNSVDRNQGALYPQPEFARTKLGDHKLFGKRVEHVGKLVCWNKVMRVPEKRAPPGQQTITVISVDPADGISILKREGSEMVRAQLDHRARASSKKSRSE